MGKGPSYFGLKKDYKHYDHLCPEALDNPVYGIKLEISGKERSDQEDAEACQHLGSLCALDDK